MVRLKESREEREIETERRAGEREIKSGTETERFRKEKEKLTQRTKEKESGRK